MSTEHATDAANRAQTPAAEEPSDETCDFCERLGLFFGTPETLRPLYTMTDREIQVHEDMRRLKLEARFLKSRMRRLEMDLENGRRAREREEDAAPVAAHDRIWHQGVLDDLRESAERLDRVRTEWGSLDRERRAAAEERMRLLGHHD